jgi:hypothetical protein
MYLCLLLNRLTGNSTHGGGSCQIALSHDKGGSFGVIKSYIGDCVRADPLGDQIFGFTIPDDTPIGDALLSWYEYRLHIIPVLSLLIFCLGAGSTM